ncbi:MAG: dTDP-4-dehydrorhamnose 3,5-epimerase family protein [Parvularculaceae bacterium]
MPRRIISDRSGEAAKSRPLKRGAITRTGLEGVVITSFRSHRDHRGAFTEVFRAAWPTEIAPVQWNVVTSRANVLRGFHVHITHRDYLMAISGELMLGLKDIRRDSPTRGCTEIIVLSPENPAAVTIPTGVAHGFYYSKPSTHLYSVSHYWNIDDELGCRWDDPEIGIDWPTTAPLLSERDENAGSFAQMVEAYERAAFGRSPSQVRLGS